MITAENAENAEEEVFFRYLLCVLKISDVREANKKTPRPAFGLRAVDFSIRHGSPTAETPR
jgi:hypothetical protein